MNELLIIGIAATAFVLMFAITAIIENFGAVCRFLRCACAVIGNWVYEWLFDVVTEYYMYKARRARKKARR